MKLVDILARELKVWPHPGNALGQAADTTLHLNERASHGDEFYGWTKEKFTRAEDHHEAFVTRAQWQAAVDALKAGRAGSGGIEWNGEGLPPVGIDCERAFSHSTWKETHICGHSTDGAYAAFYDGDGLMGWNDHCKFRPARTPEQIAKQERSKACDKMYGVILDRIPQDRRNNGSDICEALYDAGYRKFEIVDN